MSRVYLIRHGQAGLRCDYDRLSDLGAAQAAHLRDWFAKESIRLDRVIAGSMVRQVETARIAAAEPEFSPALNEFDLDVVYRSLAPMLRNADPQFQREYDEMMAVMHTADAPVHRQWNRCDVTVFQAWHTGKYPVEGESWTQFKSRVLAALDLIRGCQTQRHIGIFTSGTPIGLILASLFGAGDDHAMKLAGACYNSSVTTLRVRDGDIRLLGYNSVAHLQDPSHRTFR